MAIFEIALKTWMNSLPIVEKNELAIFHINALFSL